MFREHCHNYEDHNCIKRYEYLQEALPRFPSKQLTVLSSFYFRSRSLCVRVSWCDRRHSLVYVLLAELLRCFFSLFECFCFSLKLLLDQHKHSIWSMVLLYFVCVFCTTVCTPLFFYSPLFFVQRCLKVYFKTNMRHYANNTEQDQSTAMRLAHHPRPNPLTLRPHAARMSRRYQKQPYLQMSPRYDQVQD